MVKATEVVEAVAMAASTAEAEAVGTAYAISGYHLPSIHP